MLKIEKLFDLANSTSIIIIISIITMLIITLAISIQTVIISSVIISSVIITLLGTVGITKINIIEALTGTSEYMDALQRRGVS